MAKPVPSFFLSLAKHLAQCGLRYLPVHAYRVEYWRWGLRVGLGVGGVGGGWRAEQY